MKRIRRHILRCFAIVVAGILVAGCPNSDGPLEDVGEKIDNVVEEVDGR